MSDESKALVPIEEKQVDFYGDELTAVLVQDESQGQAVVYVPIRPICEYLALNWSGQQQRINRDPVLAAAAKIVCITHTKSRRGNPNMLCLPLRYLNGWLFGISANRVREELRQRVVQYQRDCYEILARAFLERGPAADLSPSAVALTQIREMALAIAEMASQQIELERRVSKTESRLDQAASFVGELGRRVTSIERRLSPGQPITDEQAAEISQQVKALAMLLTERDDSKNHYQAIFSELYRRFGVTSYKLIPQSQYAAVLTFLSEWRQRVMG